ncbi:MAG TPA: hypothetical protein VEB65_10555 [Solirubrobacterales bacterium]|nr:hypothetical protein [Solirubrobacterales bacterium]
MPKRPNRAGLRALSPAAVVFALLVLATVAAFAWAQRVKRDPLVVDRVTFGKGGQTAFTPNGDCRNEKIRIRFRTTVSDDGNVQIVKPGGGLVVTLARDAFLKRYTYHTYYWDGRVRGGAAAPQGRYKLRVTLLGQDRVLVVPGTIHVHDVPPKPGRVCIQSGRSG